MHSIMANILLAGRQQLSGVKIDTQQILQDARFRESGILFIIIQLSDNWVVKIPVVFPMLNMGPCIYT